MLLVFITAVELSITNKRKPTCSLYFSPSVSNYSALSYKVKMNTLSDGFNFSLGPMPDKPSFPIVKTPLHLFHIMHTASSSPHLTRTHTHTNTHSKNQSLLQYRTKSSSPALFASVIAFLGKSQDPLVAGMDLVCNVDF